MKNYTLEIKLLFEFFNDEVTNIAETRKFTYQEFQYCEPCSGICVIFLPDFMVRFQNIICENLDQAILILSKILPNICEALSIMIQIETGENIKYHPYLSFNIADIKVIGSTDLPEKPRIMEKGYYNQIFMKDSIGFRESLSLTVTHSLPFDWFGPLYEAANQRLDFFKNVLYRAIRCRDVESKYFTLFTMIEYIEAKEKNGTLIETHRLMDDSDIKIFEERFSDIFACKEKSGMDNLYSRLKQILKSATVETRAEKLCSVIRNKYEITGITRSLINYEITKDKMNEFIAARNELFHGSEAGKKSELIQLSNELLFLCLKILEKEIKIV